MTAIKPIKTLPIGGITLTPTGFWPYDEGTYYGEDQFWEGGPAPQPVTFMLEGTITQQDHGSFSTPQLYIYNGLDVRVGDWYVEAATGKALRITSIDTGVTDATYLKCTIEDVDRWEQFSDPNGVAATGTSGFIIALSDQGIPMFDNLVIYQTEISPSIGFIEDMTSRFRSRNLISSKVRVNQPGHTFTIGDSLILDHDGLFKLADAGSMAAERIIGVVTDVGIPGVNWFNYSPRGSLQYNLTPALPGLTGDLVWLDPANPGKLTATKPNSLAIPVWIKIDDTTGVKLYQGPSGPYNNFDAITDPTILDGSNNGYAYGSQWINTLTSTAWFLVDPTPGSSLWQRISDVPGPTGPVGPPAVGAYQRYEYTASAGQTLFNGSHVPGYVDVYYNGIKLQPSDYDDSNASWIILNNPANEGDPVELIAWEIASVSQLTGPTGPTGVAGVDGATGPTGPAATGAYVRHEFVATPGQTVFTLPYYVGFVDVYYNGTLLSQDQYTANDGTTIVLNNPALGGDPVVAVAWELTNISQNTGPTGPTGTVEGTVFDTIADRDLYSPTLGQVVYVLDDGTGSNAMYIAGQISPSVVWIPISIGPNGSNVGGQSGGDKRFPSTLNAFFEHDTASPLKIGTLSAGTTVLSVDLTVENAFDDPLSNVTVGTDSDPSFFMGQEMSDPTVQATFINQERKRLVGTSDVKVWVTPGSSTQGNISIVMTYQ